MNKIDVRENSRKGFLIGLGTAVLAGCGASASGLVPSAVPRNAECNIAFSKGRLPAGSRGTECTTVLDGSDLSGLTIQQIQALTTTQIYNLTGSQIGTLTNPQIPALTSPQVGAFHGMQASAVFAAAARTQQQGAPRWLVPPPTYTPTVPGSGFWAWFGAAVGGIVGGVIGGAVTGGNVVGIWFGGQLIGAVGGDLGGQGSGPTFNFWNSNANSGTGGWNSVPISMNPGQTSLNGDGFSVIGSFDSSTDTVTITVIEN